MSLIITEQCGRRALRTRYLFDSQSQTLDQPRHSPGTTMSHTPESLSKRRQIKRDNGDKTPSNSFKDKAISKRDELFTDGTKHLLPVTLAHRPHCFDAQYGYHADAGKDYTGTWNYIAGHARYNPDNSWYLYNNAKNKTSNNGTLNSKFDGNHNSSQHRWETTSHDINNERSIDRASTKMPTSSPTCPFKRSRYHKRTNRRGGRQGPPRAKKYPSQCPSGHTRGIYTKVTSEIRHPQNSEQQIVWWCTADAGTTLTRQNTSPNRTQNIHNVLLHPDAQLIRRRTPDPTPDLTVVEIRALLIDTIQYGETAAMSLQNMDERSGTRTYLSPWDTSEMIDRYETTHRGTEPQVLHNTQVLNVVKSRSGRALRRTPHKTIGLQRGIGLELHIGTELPPTKIPAPTTRYTNPNNTNDNHCYIYNTNSRLPQDTEVHPVKHTAIASHLSPNAQSIQIYGCTQFRPHTIVPLLHSHLNTEMQNYCLT